MTNKLASASDQQLWTPKAGITPRHASKVICSFLDTAVSSMGRGTHYNSREEQQAAELAAHEALLNMSRDVYTVMLALPGLTDRSVQVGMKNLLGTTRNGAPMEFLQPLHEREVMYHLLQALRTDRMLKLLDGLRVGSEKAGIRKANNSRTRKLILRTLLGSSRLQLWAVKYRKKVNAALTHAWGKRLASIIREVIRKPGNARTNKERDILAKNIGRFCSSEHYANVLQCVGFALGVRERLTLPLLRGFMVAHEDLQKGMAVSSKGDSRGLPPEVLEGIRSTSHPDMAREVILKMAAESGSFGKQQKMNVQRSAKKAGVKVDMDPADYDAIKLYIYAFEMGLDEKIASALDIKAQKAAEAFPAHYGNVGIVVDASTSMSGHGTQAMRPAAAALAMRDMLQYVADSNSVYWCGGGFGDGDKLVRPMGDTALADTLIDALSADTEPDAVFVISDGYENAPAGRFAEVMTHVREIGVQTPIYHLNPVFAAESRGVRELAPNEGVPTLPIQQPSALGPTFIRGLIEAEPVKGINTLIRMALTGGPEKTRKVLAA
jgi:hypothetical protein